MIRLDPKTAAPRMPSDDGTEDLDGLVDLDDLEDLDFPDGLDSIEDLDDLDRLEEPQSRAGGGGAQSVAARSPRHAATTPPHRAEAPDSALDASAGSGNALPKATPQGPQEATQSAQSPAKRQRGRPPSHVRLVLKDDATMTLLAERAFGLSSNEIVLDELDCNEAQLIAFMKRRGTKAAIQRKMFELQQNGEVARRRANANLHHGVSRMTEIIRDTEMGPSAAIGATSTLSKIASVNGKQQEARKDRGPAFSVVINLPGANGENNEALRIATNDVIEGELRDE